MLNKILKYSFLLSADRNFSKAKPGDEERVYLFLRRRVFSLLYSVSYSC